MKGQLWNGSAVRLFRFVLKKPSLMIPSMTVSSIKNINFEDLQRNKFKVLVFDKDNTLTAPYSSSFYSKEIEYSISKAKEVFGNDNIGIFSNTLGFVDTTSSFNGIPVIQHQEIQKPDGMNQVLSHFQDKGIEIKPNQIVMIGDRYLTDIVFGNINGMYTIYTHPLTSKGEKIPVRMVLFIVLPLHFLISYKLITIIHSTGSYIRIF